MNLPHVAAWPQGPCAMGHRACSQDLCFVVPTRENALELLNRRCTEGAWEQSVDIMNDEFCFVLFAHYIFPGPDSDTRPLVVLGSDSQTFGLGTNFTFKFSEDPVFCLGGLYLQTFAALQK